MNYKDTYKHAEFVDFKGEVRKFTVCAVSMLHKDTETPLKSLRIGFAVCNACDEFDETVGEKIALNHALDKDNKFVMTTSCLGMINTPVVNALIDQEIEYFKNNPASHIKGYNMMRSAYEAEKATKEHEALLRSKINEEDGKIITYLKNLSSDIQDTIIELVKKF